MKWITSYLSEPVAHVKTAIQESLAKLKTRAGEKAKVDTTQKNQDEIDPIKAYYDYLLNGNTTQMTTSSGTLTGTSGIVSSGATTSITGTGPTISTYYGISTHRKASTDKWNFSIEEIENGYLVSTEATGELVTVYCKNHQEISDHITKTMALSKLIK